MSKRVFLKFAKNPSGTSQRRAAALALSTSRRAAKIMAIRTALRRPTGVLATRGFRPVGRRSKVEKKVIDVGVSTYQVNTTGSFTLLNGCIPGSDYTNRIGRKIVLKSVYIRGIALSEASITPTSPSISSAQCMRFIMFMDYQPNGAAPNVTDLLLTASPFSQLNLNNRDRFKVIRDDTFLLDPFVYNTTASSSVASMNNQIRDVNFFKKLNEEVIFNAGSAGTIADINSGALYMFWIGNVAAGASTDANAIVSSRVRFTDP